MNNVDDDNVITINIFSKIDDRWSYFSLTNFGNAKNEDELTETNSYYTEQNIRWKITDTSPLDLTLQMNFRSGISNDRHRIGFRWRLNNTFFLEPYFKKAHLSYSLNFHIIQFDNEPGNVWQIEHAFKMKFPYITDRLYLSGFIDHTFNQTVPEGVPTNPVIAEVQLGYNIFQNFYAVSEYRVNQYRRSSVNNLAPGIEYKIMW